MRKINYIIVSVTVIFLIIIISALPFGISSFLDRTTYGQSYQSNINTIQLNTFSDLTPIRKLQLIAQGEVTPISNNQAMLTKERVEQYAKDNLERFSNADLIDYADGDWTVSACEAMLFYDVEKAERYNIFWKVRMESTLDRFAELLIDDSTGGMYFIDYSANAESMDEYVSVGRTNAEHFATCYLGSIDVEYSIDECFQTQKSVWMTLVCSDGVDEAIIELHLSIDTLYCVMN